MSLPGHPVRVDFSVEVEPSRRIQMGTEPGPLARLQQPTAPGRSCFAWRANRESSRRNACVGLDDEFVADRAELAPLGIRHSSFEPRVTDIDTSKLCVSPRCWCRQCSSRSWCQRHRRCPRWRRRFKARPMIIRSWTETWSLGRIIFMPSSEGRTRPFEWEREPAKCSQSIRTPWTACVTPNFWPRPRR